jgi:fused signal recognition particle receptor
VVAAGDTHRAGAIEQLEQHTNRLSLKIVKQRYGADPSSVGRDAYDHAKKNHIDIVLMDTAGRMQTSKNLMDEMGKIVRVVKPDVKLFIGDALAGNDTINQAREFFDYTNFDGAILTKVDADAKGGSAISIAYITSRPIIYIGVGQGYDDIIPFDSNKFIESLFENAGQVGVAVEDITSMQKISELAVEKVKSVEPQTVREEEKDILLLSKPAVNPLSSIDSFSRPEEQKVETIDPKPIVQQPEPYKVKEKEQQQPKEKKSRFGFFGKKRGSEDRSKEDEEKGDNNENNKLQEKQAKEKGVEVEAQTRDKDRNPKEDKDTREQEDEKDKVVYLTDEDIEDLLK